MKYVLGSQSHAKKSALKKLLLDSDELYCLDVPSLVSSQPMSSEETQKGAINRAVAAYRLGCKSGFNPDIAIGLEGGVYIQEGDLYLCNWGALVNKNEKVFLSSGPVIRLPNSFISYLQQGAELVEILAELVKSEKDLKEQACCGFFTSGRVSRIDMFYQVCLAIVGQYEAESNNRLDRRTLIKQKTNTSYQSQ